MPAATRIPIARKMPRRDLRGSATGVASTRATGADSIRGTGAGTGADSTRGAGVGTGAASATASETSAGFSPRAHSGEQNVITLPPTIFAAGARSGSTVFWQFGQIIRSSREAQHRGLAVLRDELVDVRDEVVAALHHGRDLV